MSKSIHHLVALARHWPVVLRLVLATLLFNALQPAEPRATPQVQQTVVTTLPQLCVHTRLIDEVWEWKIQRSLQLVREMGADTIVEFFPWAYMETTPGRFDWNLADRIMRHARNQGLQVIARMGFVPAWARPDADESQPGTLNSLPRAAWGDFAHFVAEFARRYRDDLQHVVIWNEPNLAFEWGFETVSPGDYVALLQVVHEAVRAASPGTIILAAGPAPTLEPPGSPYGMNDLHWLEAMYAAGAAYWSDGLALHSYGFRDAPATAPSATRLNFRRVELQREIMLRHDDPVRPVILTETGWNDDPRHEQAVSPAWRIRYTLDALEYAAQHWPWLDKLCLWALRYPAPAWSWRDGFTLVTPEFLTKPLYHAIRNLALGHAQGAELWLAPPAAPA